MASGPVSTVDLAMWQDVQDDLRHLTLQRSLRFVAAAILAPFGVSGVKREAEGLTLGVPALAFGIALLLLAIAEMASLVQSGLLAKVRESMEKDHPALKPRGKKGRFARGLTLASGPGFSTALYALLGAAFVVASVLPWT